MSDTETRKHLEERHERAVYLRNEAEKTYMHAAKNYEEAYEILKKALKNLVDISKIESELKGRLD